MADNVQDLYNLLREADKKAQGGDEQAKADAQSIYNHIQYVENKAKAEGSEEYPPVLAGVVGEGAAIAAKGTQLAKRAFIDTPKAVSDMAQGQKTQNQILADLIKQNQAPTGNRGVTMPNADANWTKSMAGISPTGSQMTKESLKQAQSMTGAIGPGGPAAGGSISPSGNVILPPNLKAEREAANELRKAKIEQQLRESSLMGRLGKYGSMVGDIGGKALTKANPYLQAFSTPYEAVDTYNKFNRGDNVGGVLSAIGTGAGMASLYPPLTLPMGALSLGAHGADMAYQSYMRNRGQPQQENEQQPTPYATGGLVFIR
jgi:hypothetical protein